MSLFESAPSLPQNDGNPERRARGLTEARDAYRWNYAYLPPVALADVVPPSDFPSLEWVSMVSEKMIDISHNTARVDQVEERAERHHKDHTALGGLILAASAGGARRALEKAVDLAMEGETEGRASGLEDFTWLFQAIAMPPIAASHWDDQTFAAMRVAGPNPMMLARVPAPPETLPVGEEHYRAAMGPGDTLEAAGREGRLYLCDYAMLDGAECGTFPAGQKYLTAPLALFAVPPVGARSRALRPVAIQCAQRPGPEAPVFGPRDGIPWLMAKTCVNVADGNMHQAFSHLGRTHMVMEPIVVATARQLAANHPLTTLLKPHFEGTLTINEAAQSKLIAPGGGVDAVMGGTIETSRAVAVKAVQTWVFEEAHPRVELLRRGVHDLACLPEYPYRDDALLVYDAIAAWVRKYLSIYYASDAVVAADTELRAWAAEIGAQDGGRLRGFGRGGRIETFDDLCATATLVIFTASAQHAAVNFPQLSIMSYAPAFPLSAFRPAPTSCDATHEDYLDLLPRLDVAQIQLHLGYLLGSIHYTKLGKYPWHLVPWRHFTDGRVGPHLEAFTKALEGVEATIVQRNRTRPSYEVLLPSTIPQSINI